MKDFMHHSAHSIDEAVSLLRKKKGKAKLNAGGTDLIGLLKHNVLPNYPESIIDIKCIQGLDYIREDKEGLKIGALAKLSSIAGSEAVKEKYGVLAEAARSVASPEIRNMGTAGGNLAQEVRCWYYRYPDQLGGSIACLRKGGTVCNALIGDNRYHSIFGAAGPKSYSCASRCPAHTAMPAYLARVRSGSFMEAARVLVDFNPLPAITGRVCSAFCESKCKRGEFDAPVGIKSVERFLGDYMLENSEQVYGMPKTTSGRSIAVVGSGPAGLSAAYYLRRAGHAVTVYEKLPEAGGMLLYCIPPYRLPREVVGKQVDALRGMGIDFKPGVDVEKQTLVDNLARRFDAVLIASGAWKERPRGMKGDAPVLSGLEFLIRVKKGERSVPGKDVAVVGGGNVAIDVARTILRLGAKPVVFYRRGPKEMPALEDEVKHAREEGVAFQFLTLPTSASKADGKISLTCVKMKLGAPDATGRRQPVVKPRSEFTNMFDAVIEAIGEDPDYALLPAGFRERTMQDASSHLIDENVYRAGDFMNGASTVIDAVASGREAARVIQSSFAGRTDALTMEQHGTRFTSAIYDPAPRVASDDLPPLERQTNLDREDIGGITAEQAAREATRCFNCGCVAVHPSDLGVALVALDGRIVTSKRTVDAAGFFAPDATASTLLDSDEVITEIQVPRPPNGARQRYFKFTLRKPIDFAIVSLAILLQSEKGICTDARIALGAVAPAPFRANSAEEKLIGKPITGEIVTEAVELALRGVIPLSKNAYKVQITRTLMRRALLDQT